MFLILSLLEKLHGKLYHQLCLSTDVNHILLSDRVTSRHLMEKCDAGWWRLAYTPLMNAHSYTYTSLVNVALLHLYVTCERPAATPTNMSHINVIRPPLRTSIRHLSTSHCHTYEYMAHINVTLRHKICHLCDANVTLSHVDMWRIGLNVDNKQYWHLNLKLIKHIIR